MVRRVNDSLSLLYVSMQVEVRLPQTIKRGIMACRNDTEPVTQNYVRNESGHMFSNRYKDMRADKSRGNA